MRLPNGYGGVKHLQGARRKPWAAVKSTWIDGKQKQVYIGYYRLKSEALAALAEYNHDPYNLGTKSITFADVYKQWFKAEMEQQNENTQNNYVKSYRVCAELHDIPIRDIKLINLQAIVDAQGDNYYKCIRLRTLWKSMYKFALKFDYISRDISGLVQTPSYKQKSFRSSIPTDNILLLWDKQQTTSDAMERSTAEILLSLLYTGCRVNELLCLKKENVNMKKHCFDVIKSKTRSGVRTVPIADAIYPIFEKRFVCSKIYLFEIKPSQGFGYDNYQKHYQHPFTEKYELNFVTHETRHTFISAMTEAGIDERIIKKIVGHIASNVTEDVYTHINISVMLECVNKIDKIYRNSKLQASYKTP